jgi:hypothetical protein
MLEYYKDQLLYIILNENDNLYENGKSLGEKIYRYGGSKALFTTMNLLLNEIMENEYSDEYLESLRLLEFSWNNICNKWQA